MFFLDKMFFYRTSHEECKVPSPGGITDHLGEIDIDTFIFFVRETNLTFIFLFASIKTTVVLYGMLQPHYSNAFS